MILYNLILKIIVGREKVKHNIHKEANVNENINKVPKNILIGYKWEFKGQYDHHIYDKYQQELVPYRLDARVRVN